LSTFVCNFIAPNIKNALKEREDLNEKYRELIGDKMTGVRVTRLKHIYDDDDNLPVPAGTILSCDSVDLKLVSEKVWFCVDWDKGHEDWSNHNWGSSELELE
jgi:hypothetical protein